VRAFPIFLSPQLTELNAQGRFPVEKLTKFYSLNEVNQAAQDSEKAGTIKPIIRLSPA
jgi:aryl-alcohol dehydrogenase